ncbi:MAG: glycosyltransferase family 1 protein [Planctomycetota bacterium]
MLRVCLDYRPAILTSAGIGRATRELARAIAARNDVQLHLFAHSLSPAARPDRPPPGARLHRLPIPGRTLPWLARLGLPAPRLAGGPHAFHWTDYVHPPTGRTPAVLTLHDLAFAADPSFHGAESGALLQRTQAAARGAAVIVTPTQATAAAAQTHLDVPPEKLRVIAFGADHVPGTPGDSPRPGRPYALMLGTIEPRKNHLAVLRAWPKIPDPKPDLVVVGRRGWECDAIVGRLREAEARGEAIWHDAVDDAAAFNWLANAALLIYPSLLEGFGFPPLEALAMGTPVVASDIPALREVLGGAACYCDPQDQLSIIGAIDRSLRHRGLRTELRERGLARAAELTWERSAAAHVEVYRAVAQGSQPASV